MNKYGFARAINGISINGREWILTNDDKSILTFHTKKEAEIFRKKHNLPKEYLQKLRGVE